MKPWETLARTKLKDGTELALRRHPSETVIEVNGQSLMSSRQHASEEALARLGCADAAKVPRPRVMIGGLGMGYTLRAALDLLPADAVVVVSELVPEVADWNRGPLADLAGRPLDDARVQLEIGDVVKLIRNTPGKFDAILLDVDNGPTDMTIASNKKLYGGTGLAAARAALNPAGTLAVWSQTNEPDFERRLRAAGFEVRQERVHARAHKGSKHTIVIARRQE